MVFYLNIIIGCFFTETEALHYMTGYFLHLLNVSYRIFNSETGQKT